MTGSESRASGSPQPEWPETDGSADQNLEAFRARVGEVAAMRADERARERPDDDVDGPFFDAYYDLLTQRVAQSIASAETIQRSAGAIAAIYGTVLGVVFSVQDHPLPLRGLIPAIFLGIAVVGSTIHLGWHQGTGGRLIPTVNPQDETDTFLRRRAFVVDFTAIVTNVVNRRMGWRHASIAALGIALVTIPAPFIDVQTGDEPPVSLAAIEPTWSEALDDVPDTGSADLDAVLFEAQVAEVATLREAQISASVASDDDGVRISWLPSWTWFGVTVVLLAGVAFVGWRADRSFTPSESADEPATVVPTDTAAS